MAEACKKLGEHVLVTLRNLSEDKLNEDVVNQTQNQLQIVSSLADTINTSLQGATPENLADLLESEMTAMDKAIEEAANNIQAPYILKNVKNLILISLFFVGASE